MKLLLERSFLLNVREQSSTAANRTTASGFDFAIMFAFASPLTPPAQPSPQRGYRLTLGLSLRELISRASHEGVLRPVVLTRIISVISLKLTPAIDKFFMTDSRKQSKAIVLNK